MVIGLPTVLTHRGITLIVYYYCKWSSNQNPSTSLCWQLPAPIPNAPKKMLRAQTACLWALHWAAEELHHSPQQRAKQARRTRRQPISGLVSLQHLGGTEPSGGLELRQRGGETLQHSATRNYGFVIFDKKGGGFRHQVIKTEFGVIGWLILLDSAGGVDYLHVFLLGNMKVTAHTADVWGCFLFCFMSLHASFALTLKYNMQLKL